MEFLHDAFPDSTAFYRSDCDRGSCCLDCGFGRFLFLGPYSNLVEKAGTPLLEEELRNLQERLRKLQKP